MSAEETDERRARVVLSLISEPGDPRFTDLAHEVGGVRLLQAIRTDPERHDLLMSAAARLRELDVDAELARAERCGARFVIPGDGEWPSQLDDLAAVAPLNERGGVPIGLWVRGPLRLDTLAGSVAIVGARSATSYGNEVAADIAAEIGLAGVPVVSGAAYGIDYAAHRGALSADAPTVAVLACGPDRAYPVAHRRLLEHLATHHAVVSDAPPGAAPTRIRFLSRNRLIAALARGTVVVEAAARSGSLTTMNWAERLSRITMGVPGPVTSAASVGVHQAMRHGASIVTSGADVLELVGAAGANLTEDPRAPRTARDRLSVHDRQVLDAVPVTLGAPADSIAKVAGLGILSVQPALTRLRRGGLVERDPHGWRLTEAARESGGHGATSHVARPAVPTIEG
ncbi:DNA-protecting protein DprA [Nocardioides silvaticus]|uniref:DNA-protecting protein DprA n=1 Tax=Nocardioides silvaticus TaxID=2201891 RepID=A0A316TBG0_9ACTN|nr:DNA-processing protein DprA [Nocardioides silvaticus]PWN01750.1 DNA-protecting protein DprA [Nocardioides silvaticus]